MKDEKQRKEFMQRVEFYKQIGLNPIQAISAVQSEEQATALKEA